MVLDALLVGLLVEVEALVLRPEVGGLQVLVQLLRLRLHLRLQLLLQVLLLQLLKVLLLLLQDEVLVVCGQSVSAEACSRSTADK